MVDYDFSILGQDITNTSIYNLKNFTGNSMKLRNVKQM